MKGSELDRHITGNYGEDQFDPDQTAALENVMQRVEDACGESDIDWTDKHTGMTEADAHELGKLLETYGIAEIIRTVTLPTDKPEEPTLMCVSVINRQAMDDLWGTPGYRMIIDTVYIGINCPVCGKPRGMPYQHRFYESGDYHVVDKWDNACGHVDSYKDVLREAQMIRDGEL